MNTAVIVAAGSGTRFDPERPKQFAPLLGKPVLVHTIERFEECDEISAIVLVLAESEVESFSKILQRYNFSKITSVVSGGVQRADSVANGLAVIPEGTEVVAVHDGARPLVTADEISRVVRRASETGAACLVAPVSDTIKQVDGGVIAGTVDRRDLRRAMTPQCFKVEILRNAFANSEAGNAATDDCYLVERMGYEIAAVPGSQRNIKLTFPEDLLFAEAILNS